MGGSRGVSARRRSRLALLIRLFDDKALLFIIQYKQIVSTLVWNPVQAREEQETPQIQKRGKYNHNELYIVENTALARSDHGMIDPEGRRAK